MVTGRTAAFHTERRDQGAVAEGIESLDDTAQHEALSADRGSQARVELGQANPVLQALGFETENPAPARPVDPVRARRLMPR